MSDELVIAQLVAATWMTCVGWIVLRLTYPALADVPADRWVAIHTRHSVRITPLVAPPMMLQLVAAMVGLVDPPAGSPVVVAAAIFALVVTTWALTAFVSVRHHRTLESSFDDAAHAGLSRGHAVRTACWTLALALSIVQLALIDGGIQVG